MPAVRGREGAPEVRTARSVPRLPRGYTDGRPGEVGGVRRPAHVGPWPDAGVTFDQLKGAFDISPEVMARFELTGDDFEIRREFARHLSVHEEARPYRRVKTREGGLRVYWREIRVVAVSRWGQDYRGDREALAR